MSSDDLSFTIIAVVVILGIVAVRIARIVTNNWTTEADVRCNCDLRQPEQK